MIANNLQLRWFDSCLLSSSSIPCQRANIGECSQIPLTRSAIYGHMERMWYVFPRTLMTTTTTTHNSTKNDNKKTNHLNGDPNRRADNNWQYAVIPQLRTDQTRPDEPEEGHQKRNMANRAFHSSYQTTTNGWEAGAAIVRKWRGSRRRRRRRRSNETDLIGTNSSFRPQSKYYTQLTTTRNSTKVARDKTNHCVWAISE